MKGFAKLVESSGRSTLDELILELAQATQTRLISAWDGCIWEWTNEGNRIQSSANQLIQSLNLSASVHFQMWFEDGADLFCSVDVLPQGQIVHTYGFDGLDRVRSIAVGDFAVTRFRQKALEDQAVLLVVDDTDLTEDHEWFPILGDHIALPAKLPVILGFDRRRRAAFAPEALFQGRVNYDIGSCLLSVAAEGHERQPFRFHQ